MAKEAVFTMKLEPELRDAFMAAAQRQDRPASQIVREFMRDYAQQDQEYVEFLRHKVEISRAEFAAGLSFSQDEVEAEAAKRRERLLRKAAEAAS